MAIDARGLANFLLDEAETRGLELTNLALNKILYFCHAWHLAKTGEPLLAPAFEAWEHGPVVPSIYHHFKSNGNRRISNRATRIDLETGEDVVADANLEETTKLHLVQMLEFYGDKPGSVLRNMSHEKGAPWDLVWSTGGAGMQIPDDLIANYFSDRLKARKN